jgi:quinol monooxygenase YgiN
MPLIHNGARREDTAKLLTVFLAAKAAKQTELVQMLEALGQELAAAPGCIKCVVTREVSDASRFILFITYRDRPSLEAQLMSDNFRILRGAMDILSEPAQCRIASADWVQGFTS